MHLVDDRDQHDEDQRAAAEREPLSARLARTSILSSRERRGRLGPVSGFGSGVAKEVTGGGA